MATQQIETTCCVIGGGPAGVMLGYLLARRGVPVTVLEKHKDFFRDFRGDTVHPSTLELMHELGILDDFLKLPHQELTSAGAVIGGYPFEAANFSRVPTRCKFVALMPQWDFLNFLSAKAKQYPDFDLRMEHEAVGLLNEGRNVTGVEVRTPQGPVEVRARLVVGCDGRHSTTRQAGHLEIQEFGVPIDVLWFRISRKQDDPDQVLGNINYGRVLILINRGDYFQAGLIVPKGSFEEVKSAGLEEFHNLIARIAPYLADRVHEIHDWDQIKLLTVQINRLRQWHLSGLLCIGDAAHAMSPAGGVGINLAIQDAVAAANILTEQLRSGTVTEAVLARVQKRREFPTRFTQFLQVNAHKLFKGVFQNTGPIQAPAALKAVVNIPGIQHIMARVIGVGVRPEHVIQRTNKKKLALLTAAATVAGYAAARLVLAARRKQPAHAAR